MYGEEITKAAEEFIATGNISKKASFPYINPYTGEFIERGFNPFKLIQDLKRRGFHCRIARPPWTYLGFPPRMVSGNETISRITLQVLRKCPTFLLYFISSCFYILARKTR